ncbi:MAG: hypothetical protein ACNA78_05525 [Balneolaceae bacterium]
MSSRSLFLFLAAAWLLIGCSTTRWTITDEAAVNPQSDPVILSEKVILTLEQSPVPERPTLRFRAFSITDQEFEERVLVERTVQNYRPRWGFATLALTGAAFALLTANTSVIIASTSAAQSLAFNISGILVGSTAAFNLKESGDPIFTGEERYLRRTGFRVVSDTTRYDSPAETAFATVQVKLGEEYIFSSGDVELIDGTIELNLAPLADQIPASVSASHSLLVEAEIEGSVTREEIEIGSFLSRFFVVRDDLVQARGSAEQTRMNVVSDLAEGSTLPLVEEEDEWVRVELNGEQVFLPIDTGHIVWRSPSGETSGMIVQLADLPFGEIDVERDVPLAKPHNNADRAWVLSNRENNQLGSRAFTDRTERLFFHYMQGAFQLRDEQMGHIHASEAMPSFDPDRECGPGGGSLYLYVTGFARASGEANDVLMTYENGEGETSEWSLRRYLSAFPECGFDRIFLFVDIDYIEGDPFLQNGRSAVLRDLANTLTRLQPNMAIVFGNQAGQRSSMFTGAATNDKRHPVFMYYWADALQQRKTRIEDLVQHLRDNVDYTSRRLHDRPQEVQAFGELTLDMAGR